MTHRQRAFQKPPRAGWLPKINDVVYLPPRKPFLRSARGRVGYVMRPYLAVVYFAHGVRKEFIFEPHELRPCRGRCRVLEFRKG